MLNDELESLIGTYGLFAIIDALSGICGRKAETSTTAFDLADWKAAEAVMDVAADKVVNLFAEKERS